MNKTDLLSKTPELREWQQTYRYPKHWGDLHHVKQNLSLSKDEQWALGDLLNKRLQFHNYKEPVYRAFTWVVHCYSFQPNHEFNLFEAFFAAHKIHNILDKDEQFCLESDCLMIQQAACLHL